MEDACNGNSSAEAAGEGSATHLTREELLRRAAAGGAVLSVPGLVGSLVSDAAAAGPRRGGQLRVGISVGKTESFDAHNAADEIDIARIKNLYERLADFDRNNKPYLTLAKELVPNKTGTVWTIPLKRGILFHNGKELTADDVVYSFRRILDKSLGLQATVDLPFLTPENVQKVDKYTVRLRLSQPIGDMLSTLAARGSVIIPAGFNDFKTAIGTGPFKFKSWTPGQNSVFVRNPNWWQDKGRPYVDQLVIVPIGDSTTRLNALLGGQVDAIAQLEASQVGTLTSRGMPILNARSGAWTPLVMATQRPPFDDVRVRQAFRLIVDRKQMVQNVLLGFGTVGNDLFSPLDPMYARDLPQRQPDVEKAKSLLKAAGKEGLEVTLFTGDFAPGALNSAILFAEQAKAAGVKVDLNQGPAATYYDDAYEKVPLFQTFWSTRPLPSQLLQATVSQAPFNETQWIRPSFDNLINTALSTVDEKKRRALYHDAQQQLWNEGGYVIWGFPNSLDGYASKVKGFRPHLFRNLSWYGFHEVWIA